MLQNPTTFVVGAGASHEFGLPIGRGLADQIADSLNIQIERGYQIASGDAQIAESLRQACPRSNEWQMACWRIRNGLPALADSIDNFLDNHRDDDAMQLAGRVGIVKGILVAERASKLYFDPRVDDTLDFAAIQDTWLGQLFRILQRKCPKPNIEKFFDNCRMVIFNYDRCIEFFFTHALRQYYSVELRTAQQIVADAEFYHVYGSVGALPAPGVSPDSIVEFGSTAVQLVRASQGIRTYTDRVTEDTMTSAIHEAINSANTLVFLGFGFHPQNLDLLTNPGTVINPRIIASAFEVSEFNIRRHESNIRTRFTKGAHEEALVRNLTCAKLMSDFSGAFN